MKPCSKTLERRSTPPSARCWQASSVKILRKVSRIFWKSALLLSKAARDPNELRVQSQSDRSTEATSRFHGRAHLPKRTALPQRSRTRSLEAHESNRRAEAKSARGRSMESISTERRSRRGAHEPRICSSLRDHGPQPLGPRSFQLLCARYRKYRSSCALWNGSAKRNMAKTPARGRNPVVFRDDGA